MGTIEQQLRAFIIDTFLFGDESTPLATGDSFIEHGIIDSTGILEVVQFVEERFGIRVADEDLIPENLDSIDRLSAFIERKRAGQVTAAQVCR